MTQRVVPKALQVPAAGRPDEFRRYLQQSDRRFRKLTGSGSVYDVVVALLWFGSGLVVAGRQELFGPAPENPLLSWPAGALLLAAFWVSVGVVCHRWNPVVVPAAWLDWVLSTPLDRIGLLRHRGFGAAWVGAIPGLMAGVAVAISCGARDLAALELAVIGTSGSIVATGFAIRAQQRGSQAVRQGWPVGSGAVLTLILATTIFVLWDNSVELSKQQISITAIALVIAAMATIFSAGRTVGQIPSNALRNSGRFISWQLILMEQSLWQFAPTVASGRAEARAPANSSGTKVIAASAVRALRRDRLGKNRFLTAIVVPYLIAAIFGGSAIAPGAMALSGLLAAVVATSALAGPARRFSESKELSRHFGISRVKAVGWALIPTIFGVVNWSVVTAPVLFATAPALVVGLIPVLSWLLVALRVALPPFEPSFKFSDSYSLDMLRRLASGPIELVAAGIALVKITSYLG